MAGSGVTRLGKFDLLARIAKGGMAEIFLARQHGVIGFSRLVVVKRILAHLAEEAHFVQMFLEEARLAALISHPNVVQIHDVGQHDGSYYIAMEFVSGVSVSAMSRMARERKIPLPYYVAAEIIAQACEGLHAAHELRGEDGRLLGVVHRDISPHNLMVSEGGVVKLLDFGIAKAQDTSIKTRTGTIKGKYPYMSPEQCRGEPLDRRTDLFSLGVSFHELVMARRLFQRSTDLMTLKAITEEPIPIPSEVRSDVPSPMSEVILRSLARSVDERYQTAREMGAAIRHALERLGVTTGTEMLATFLRTDCATLLEARRNAAKLAVQGHGTGGSVPLVTGFDEASHPSEYGSVSIARTRALRRFPARRVAIVSIAAVLVAALCGLGYRFLTAKPSRPPGTPLVFGMPPSFPTAVAQIELRPFLDYLERKIGRAIDLSVPADYDSLRSGLLAGQIDIANFPPLQYILARHAYPRLRALATQTYEGASTYESFIVVRDDTSIKTLADLRGRRFCYVDRGSTSGYLLPKLHLRQQGLDPDHLFKTIRYSGNHVALLKDVAEGKCDAGGVYSVALFTAGTLGVAASRLRILAVAGQLPFDVICVSPKFPRELVEKLHAALLELRPERDLGSKILGPTFRINGFTEAKLSDFDAVEKAARADGLVR
jgi:phosphate/phosphite/phosphonate ABC transporter binding protein